MSQHELGSASARDPLLTTTPSSIGDSSFFLRPFFLAEAGANVFGGAIMLLFPDRILSAITYPHTVYPLQPSTSPSTSSIQLFQWLSGLVFALSAPLITSARSTADMHERRTTYITLAAGEIGLMAIMILQMAAGGKGAVGAGDTSEGGLTVKAIGVAFAVLGATVAARVWALGWRREWFGDESQGGRGVRQERPKSRAS